MKPEPRGEEWFNDLFAAQFDDIVRYAAARLSNRGDAADVAAETFAISWRRRADVPAGAERPWLFGVAWRVVQSARRGTVRRREITDRLRHVTELSVPTPTAIHLDVAQALSKLPAYDRELISLTAWHGFTAAEAAQVLGISANNARVRLHRARTALKKHLNHNASTAQDASEAAS